MGTKLRSETVRRARSRRTKLRASLFTHVGLVAGALVVSILLSAGGFPGVVLALTLGAAPLLLAGFVGVPVRGWVVVLLVATCVNGVRLPIAGFNLLPEHFFICGVLVVLLLRMPEAVLRPPAAFELLLLMWIAWNGVTSVFLAPEPQRSLPIVAWLLLSWAILWAVRGYFLHAKSEDAEYVWRALLVTGAAAGVLAFALWILAFGGVPVPGVQPEPYTRTVAAKGLSFEANILGSQELFIVVAALALLKARKKAVPTLVRIGLGLGILSTMTRSVWVAAIVVVGLEWLENRRAVPTRGGGSETVAKPALLLVLAAAAMPLAFVSASNPIFTRFGGSFDLASDTAQLRLGGVKDAFGDMGGSALITGLGTNSFGQRHRNTLFADGRGYLSVLPIAVLYDTGIIGGALLLGAGVVLVLGQRGPVDRRYARTFLLVLLITGSATNPMWFGISWVLLAIVGVPWAARADGLAAARAQSA